MAELKIGFVTFKPGSGDGDQAVTVSGEKIRRSCTAHATSRI